MEAARASGLLDVRYEGSCPGKCPGVGVVEGGRGRPEFSCLLKA